jgi:hypothetical protein
MKYQFGDVSDDQVSRAAKIRALFVSGRSVAAHAEICIDANVWTESEKRSMIAAQARAEVRAALGQLTEEGVPWAGPCGFGKEPKWRQMEFWSLHDFDMNYTAYLRRERSNGKVADSIARVCRERHGRDPRDLDNAGSGEAA